PLAGGEWQRRVLVPLRGAGMGWMSSLVSDDQGELQVAFAARAGGRLYFAPVPAAGELVRPPRLARDLRRMRLSAAPNGELVLAAAAGERGAPERSALIVLRRSAGRWRQTLVDERRPVGGFLDVAAAPRGEALVLYSAEVDRGLWLYDETRIATRVIERQPDSQPASAPAAPRAR
ncbi:MAG: hypothetical protein JXR83_03725, partial [Deltaproteobacteria bacterium]|nr:hypothetical protein [Deltaproteobacteria bacterium]